jgi:hypothetical protein
MTTSQRFEGVPDIPPPGDRLAAPWKCNTCGGDIGAVLSTRDGEWQIMVPVTCKAPRLCTELIRHTADNAAALLQRVITQKILEA